MEGDFIEPLFMGPENQAKNMQFYIQLKLLKFFEGISGKGTTVNKQKKPTLMFMHVKYKKIEKTIFRINAK